MHKRKSAKREEVAEWVFPEKQRKEGDIWCDENAVWSGSGWAKRNNLLVKGGGTFWEKYPLIFRSFKWKERWKLAQQA